jgi:hypothetical protein
MRNLVLAAVATAALLSWSGTAEAAKIKMKPAKCPVAADASFKIVGARGELDGVASEYEWIRTERPGWKPKSQALIGDDRKQFDLLTIQKGRKKQVICFDITSFFGKAG